MGRKCPQRCQPHSREVGSVGKPENISQWHWVKGRDGLLAKKTMETGPSVPLGYFLRVRVFSPLNAAGHSSTESHASTPLVLQAGSDTIQTCRHVTALARRTLRLAGHASRASDPRWLVSGQSRR